MDGSAPEFLPFRSNLGRTSIDRQICLKRKIIVRVARHVSRGIEGERESRTDERTDSQSESERNRRQQVGLRLNQIFCVVTVVVAMIGRGRCRECDGFITFAF